MQLALFDYDELDSETRIVVRQRATEIKDLVRSTASNIVTIGEKLSEVQKRLAAHKSGSFQAWLNTELEWSQRTAYNFISVYKRFGNRANFAQLNVASSALYLLASPSTSEDVVDTVIAASDESDTPISQSQVKGLKEIEQKAPPAIKKMVFDGQLSPAGAVRMSSELASADKRIVDLVALNGCDNPERVKILKRLFKSMGSPETNGTFEEIERTGGFHYGKDMEQWLDFWASDIQDITKALETVAKHHAREQAEERRRKRIEQVKDSAEITGTYPVIYADPPWQYDHQSTPNRAIENHYPTQGVEFICNIEVDGRKVRDVASEDAVLFLWATNPKLKEAFQVIEAWGFEYVTNLVWVKNKWGQGYHVRGQHELLLICKRGNIPVPHDSNRVSSVLHAAVSEHSAKPQEVYSIIEGAYPEYERKLELFARIARKGWQGWGYDYDSAA